MGAALTLITATDRRTSPRKLPHASFPVALKTKSASAPAASGRRLSAVLTDVSRHGLCLSLRSFSGSGSEATGLRRGDAVELLTLSGPVALQVAWVAADAACGLACPDESVDLARMLSFFCD
jgi:hypothetical protein